MRSTKHSGTLGLGNGQSNATHQLRAAAELQHPAALPFLFNLVLTPIPPEESPDPHSFSTVAEETILRTTAVEGIGHLAKSRVDSCGISGAAE
jgi:hypothetical protein